MEQQVTDSLVQHISKQIIEETRKQVSAEVLSRLQDMDISLVVNEIVNNKLETLIKVTQFPPKSISHTSVNFANIKLSGDMINGGIIKNFSSTGIDDRSTDIQMTVMDQGIALEGTLFAPKANIKGDLTVDGEIKGTALDKLINNTVASLKLNEELLNSHADKIHEQIATKGLQLEKIIQNGKEAIGGDTLGYHITESNLRRVGHLRELQVEGESVIADTLYVTPRRVGINTNEPSETFVVWDEEVEIVVTKKGRDCGFIGTQRNQQLVLGANRHDNLVLATDGSVEVQEIRIGNVPMSSASTIPNYDAITGTIVWNESPAPGTPIGWVCLGGTRWAKFGKVE